MWRVLTIVAAIIVAAAAGFFVPRFFQFPPRIDFKYRFGDPILTPKPIAPNVSYECVAFTQAEVYENREDGPTANVSSGKGGDEVALKITEDGKGMMISFPFAAANDTADFDKPIPIAAQNGNYVVASRTNGADIVTLILDVNTLKAVYSYSGQGMVGIRGRSLLLGCR